MTRTICLNADVGELPGEGGRALDRAILDIVSRCNIACGGHAGDETSMLATLKAAKARNVLAGVHPSYPDRENFGRVSMDLPIDELTTELRQQVRTFQSLARETGVAVAHLKPHGALYNDAAKNASLSEAIIQVARQTGIGVVVGPPQSELSRAARAASLSFLAEGFADRQYLEDGSLMPRDREGAVLTRIEDKVGQVVSLVDRQRVKAEDGSMIPMDVQTICLHGDTPGALRSALELRAALHAFDISIVAGT